MPIKTYGVNAFGDVVSGSGFYRKDLTFPHSRYFSRCNASVTDASVHSGMSGGGAFNLQGELVGIIAAIASKHNTRLANGKPLPYQRLSLFVSLNYVKTWLAQELSQYYNTRVDVTKLLTNEGYTLQVARKNRKHHHR
jgi:S1-C subfamily serine protease